MYAGKVVSYKAIIDKVSRDFGFENEIEDETCIEWLAEFMAHTNSGVVMDNKIAYISICDGRGDLPFDLHKIDQTARLAGVESIDDAICGIGKKFLCVGQLTTFINNITKTIEIILVIHQILILLDEDIFLHLSMKGL